MIRLAVAFAPLILAASAFSAQAQDPHAGHTMPAPARPAPAPTPQTPARPAAEMSWPACGSASSAGAMVDMS